MHVTRWRMWQRRRVLVICGALTFGPLLAALDLLLGRSGLDGLAFALEVFEWTVILGAAAAAAWLAVTLRSVRADQSAMRDDLARAVDLGPEWRAQHGAALEDLSGAISRQFDVWGLTPAEAEIAGLMLKGVALRDIARLRQTSETDNPPASTGRLSKVGSFRPG